MTGTEREALCARIDELCAEVERLRNQLRDQQDTAEHNFVRNAREYKRVCDENAKLREERDHWHVEQVHAFGNWEDAYKRAIELEKQNAKLRELAARMARALGVGRWCSADCGREFGCDWTPEGCPIANAMRELGVDE